MKFSWTLSTSAQQVPQPPIQNQCPLILLSSFSIDPIRLSSLHKFKNIFTNVYIPPWLWKIFKFMVLDKWKMELWVKKFKVDISTVPIITTKAEIDYSFPPVMGEDYENLVNFFKTCTLRCLINGAGRLSIFPDH